MTEAQQRYSDLLKDPRWQKRRLEIFQRDDFTCQICGDAESTLNIHHRRYSYGKKPWEYTDNDLVTLCESCHGQETEGWTVHLGNLIDSFNYAGYFSHDLEELQQIVINSTQMGMPPTAALNALVYLSGTPERQKKLHDMYFEGIRKELSEREVEPSPAPK